MVTETTSEIERIEIANEDLIDVLASLADGDDRRLALVGEDDVQMAVPADDRNVVEGETLRASDLIDAGDVADDVQVV